MGRPFTSGKRPLSGKMGRFFPKKRRLATINDKNSLFVGCFLVFIDEEYMRAAVIVLGNAQLSKYIF
jgi:hypothetical protein